MIPNNNKHPYPNTQHPHDHRYAARTSLHRAYISTPYVHLHAVRTSQDRTYISRPYVPFWSTPSRPGPIDPIMIPKGEQSGTACGIGAHRSYTASPMIWYVRRLCDYYWHGVIFCCVMLWSVMLWCVLFPVFCCFVQHCVVRYFVTCVVLYCIADSPRKT